MTRSPASILFDVHGSQTALKDGYSLTSGVNGYMMLGSDGIQTHFIKVMGDGRQIVSEGRDIYILSTALPPGNLTLADTINWNCETCFIRDVSVSTASTDFDVSICDSNQFDQSSPSTRMILSGGSGNTVIPVNMYNRSSSTSLYIIYQDRAGSSTARFYITGIAK